MRVKRLEIQGFKSFKDKTVIHFDHGITGIVGPNGCGKSNIVDSFFWVMGEQSYKHMRGTGSEDLIFNGSSKYSPLGLAEATLVMETDAVDTENAPAGASAQDVPVHLRSKEVSVTRRLYRSGEGEYFINGQPARLKDIQELFMDTGVGAKGYSVIEQGQIGKIVNSKPEDRRLLIEEAAGIAKYKARKKESLRKMEATQANLSRLNDIIQEIERSLRSLERQAQKARSHKRVKDELLDKEMTWGRRKSLVLKQRLESLAKKREILEQELAILRADLQVKENDSQVDRVTQTTEQKIAEDMGSEIQIMSAELTREESALELSRQRQGDLSSQLTRLQNEKANLGEEVATGEVKLVTVAEDADIAERTYAEITGQVSVTDAQVRSIREETEAARRLLDSTKRELMNGITQSSELTARGAALSGRIESSQMHAVRAEQQVETQQEKLSTMREELAKNEASLSEAKQKKVEFQSEIQTAQGVLRNSEEALRGIEKKKEEVTRSWMGTQSRLTSLQELAESHEGLGEGPKAVLEWAKEKGFGGKLVSLADAIEIQDGYDQAVQGWLESRLESILTSDAALALDAVASLSAVEGENRGRATIQVESVKTDSADTSQIIFKLGKSGFQVLGKLSEVVTFKGDLSKGAAASVAAELASVLVVDSLAPLAELLAAGVSLNGLALVTKGGQVADATQGGLIIRGGSLEDDRTAALIRRKRAIADLQVQLDKVTQEKDAVLANLAELQAQTDAARSLYQDLQAQLQQVQIEAAALERDVLQSTRALRDAESQLRSLEQEVEAARHQEAVAQEERAKIEDQLSAITASREELESKVEVCEADFVQKDSVLRTEEESLQQIRMKEVETRERSNSLRKELDTSKRLLEDRKRRIAEIDQIFARASQEREQFNSGESELEVRIRELTLTIAEKREAYALVRDRLAQVGARIDKNLVLIRSIHEVGDQKNHELTEASLEVEKVAGDLSHLIQNMDEKYGPGCLERPIVSPIQEEMTEPVVTAEMTAEEEQILGEEVERLRERLRNLGDVNPAAIEEFESEKKRYEHLLNEKKDLEHSIENLQEAIEHINKTSVERFNKAFEAIAIRFEKLFPIIFGGGQAKLSLVYPEGSSDILEAGVDILAQPPGKKIQNITLLSGGEKALTAISLIFAIFMVKPSPFCVLDEVDAPLDDANIGKFNALLREMAAKSQFIVITHNKKTMELNDTLYGVTMEEPGVSKMVSIEMK